MLTLRLPGEKEVLLQQEKLPNIKNSEILIEIKASGLCGSDLTPYKSNKQDRMSQYPSGNLNISGHEPCGIVLETGKNIKGVKIGDRIIVHHYSGCRRCKHCATGWPQLCLNGENKTFLNGEDVENGGNLSLLVSETMDELSTSIEEPMFSKIFEARLLNLVLQTVLFLLFIC